ncbi:MAG: hypothetical protein ABJB01_10430 [Rudaea sp.]
MIRTLAFGLLALCASGTHAQTVSTPSAADAVPPSLKDWRAWVLKDLDFRSCPVLGNQSPESSDAFVCAWPSRLTINATAEGATFSIRWQVDAPSWIPLPGDGTLWPQQVTVNNQRQPVVLYQNAPALRLTAGAYEIAGRIPWRQRPQTLLVPRQIGLVSLNIDGKAVVPIQRNQDIVTLGRADTAARESDAMAMRVFRKLTDGIPAQLETKIQIASSGQAREEVLGPVLPQGFTPLSLSSEWPARLDDDGRLHLQVQAGEGAITIKARADTAIDKVVARLAATPWPAQETWSYESAPMRVTSATSALQVDPRQAGVPAEWSALPAFALGNDGVLSIEQRSRGLGTDEGNRLTLQREAWLDFNGDGWYARDRVAGKMLRGWRLDLAAPYILERADAENSRRGANNGPEPLLITKGAKPELSGVEWRTPAVDLGAGVRVASAATTLPVSGWQDTFDRIDTTLHLPFGYRLIAAPGADVAAGSWMSNWTLLDAFVCAVLFLIAWRYLGAVGAIVSGIYLLLGYQETDAPFWTLLGVAALALVVRALPSGKLRAWAEGGRRVVLLFLILIALPFAAAQLRFALYPQLEHGESAAADFSGDGAIGAYGKATAYRHRVARNEAGGALDSPTAPPPATVPQEAKMEKDDRSRTVVVTASVVPRADMIEHYSESTVVQTGAGEPSWSLGSTANLSWSGPVLVDQSVHLLIAAPWLVRPLRVLLVLLLGWLIWQLSRHVVQAMRSGAPLGMTALLIAGLIATAPLQAQTYPSDQLLQQLRQRLTEAPKCTPTCAGISEAQVTANGDSIVIALDAAAIEPLALPLPTADASVMLKSIKVDGVVDESIVRRDDDTLWVSIGRGVHRVEVEYAAYADKVSFKFPLAPHRVQMAGNGWESSGLSEDRLLADALNLTRARSGAPGKMLAGAQQFPPYVRIERNLTLGLQWYITTQAIRIAPEHGSVTVTASTLTGEHVTSPDVKSEGGNVLAAIADDSYSTQWSSALDKADTLSLTAPSLADRAEVWRIIVSPTWHVEFSGVPESLNASNQNDTDYRNFEFDPLPGETLTIKVSRPVAAVGETRAIDAVSVSTEQGQHAATHTLHFATRASQGGEQSIDVPKDAEVLGVSRDGQALNLRPRDGKLSLPLVPGRHAYDISFRQTADLATIVGTPDIALGAPAANIDVSLALPADRWLLATWGPRVGPAVLYWGELLVMILAAYALSRTRRTPLRFRDWLLLGIGFSTFSWGALVVVVAWLFAFDWRSRTTIAANGTFNLAQFGLAALTAIALLCLVSAIPQGLLGQPDMHVTGYGSSAHTLRWFVDRSADALPRASAVSVPLWVYKVLMLIWALWLANALIGWLRQAFAAWTKDGYWRPRVKAAAPIAPSENP